MTQTPKRDWLGALIRAGARSDDCDECGLYPCPEHAADAVLNAVRNEDLFMLERQAADQVIWQARHDELLAASTEVQTLVKELGDMVVSSLLDRARVARYRAVGIVPRPAEGPSERPAADSVAPWIDGTVEQIAARLGTAISMEVMAITMIDGLVNYDRRPLAWRVGRIRMVLSALDQMRGKAASREATAPPPLEDGYR